MQKVKEFLDKCSEEELIYLRGYLDGLRKSPKISNVVEESSQLPQKTYDDSDIKAVLLKPLREIATFSKNNFRLIIAAVSYYFDGVAPLDTTVSKLYFHDYMVDKFTMSIRMNAMVTNRSPERKKELIEYIKSFVEYQRLSEEDKKIYDNYHSCSFLKDYDVFQEFNGA